MKPKFCVESHGFVDTDEPEHYPVEKIINGVAHYWHGDCLEESRVEGGMPDHGQDD